jgi:hypothetical protein
VKLPDVALGIAAVVPANPANGRLLLNALEKAVCANVLPELVENFETGPPVAPMAATVGADAPPPNAKLVVTAGVVAATTAEGTNGAADADMDFDEADAPNMKGGLDSDVEPTLTEFDAPNCTLGTTETAGVADLNTEASSLFKAVVFAFGGALDPKVIVDEEIPNTPTVLGGFTSVTTSTGFTEAMMVLSTGFVPNEKLPGIGAELTGTATEVLVEPNEKAIAAPFKAVGAPNENDGFSAGLEISSIVLVSTVLKAGSEIVGGTDGC